MADRRGLVASALLILVGATACAGPSASTGPSAPTGVSTTPASVSASPTTTALDGTYSTSFTRAELAASPFLMPEEINDENWGEFVLTFSGGKVAYTQRNDLASSSASGVFTVQGDAVTLVFDTGANKGETFGFRWSLSGGTLTLVRDESVGIGPTPFLVKPWTTVQ
jgi:hypothetical protein